MANGLWFAVLHEDPLPHHRQALLKSGLHQTQEAALGDLMGKMLQMRNADAN